MTSLNGLREKAHPTLCTMERRKFIKKSALAVTAGGLVAGCSSESTGSAGAPAIITQPNLRWRLISSFPRSLDTIYGAAEVFAQRVHALTDGRFDIRVYPAGEIVPYDQVLESVQKGTVQMGTRLAITSKGKIRHCLLTVVSPLALLLASRMPGCTTVAALN